MMQAFLQLEMPREKGAPPPDAYELYVRDWRGPILPIGTNVEAVHELNDLLCKVASIDVLAQTDVILIHCEPADPSPRPSAQYHAIREGLRVAGWLPYNDEPALHPENWDCRCQTCLADAADYEEGDFLTAQDVVEKLGDQIADKLIHHRRHGQGENPSTN